MLAGAGLLDLIIPRGGKSLVERVQREARVPVLAHAEGLCHTYVHAAADPDMARAVVANAKMRRTGICGATETLLIDRAIAAAQLPPDRCRSARAGLRLPRRRPGARDRARPDGRERQRFRYRMAGCDHFGRRRRWPRCSDGAHRPARQLAHRRHHHRGHGDRRAVPGRCRQRRRAVERLDTVLRRRRIRVRRRNRHRHRPHPCARPGRAGAVDDLSIHGPRHWPGASLIRCRDLATAGACASGYWADRSTRRMRGIATSPRSPGAPWAGSGLAAGVTGQSAEAAQRHGAVGGSPAGARAIGDGGA